MDFKTQVEDAAELASMIDAEGEVMKIVDLLPDLVTKVGSFAFMRTSNTDDPETAIEKYLVPFENAVKDLIKFFIETLAKLLKFINDLQQLITDVFTTEQVVAEEGQELTAEQIRQNEIYDIEKESLDKLQSLVGFLVSAIAGVLGASDKLKAIIDAIIAFETTAFSAFAVISSKRYLEVAKFLRPDYPKDFIQISKRFIASEKELPAFTEIIYQESPPEGMINSFVSSVATAISVVNNNQLPDLVQLKEDLVAEIDEAKAELPPLNETPA